MDIPIIFEDDFLLAINKPAGIAVNRSDNEKNETIQDWAEEKLKINNNELASDFYRRAGIG